MRNRSRLEITYPDVADELENWAVTRGVASDPYVIGISDAMRTGAELSFWADRDPMEWLPRPRSVVAARISHRARIVSIARNVLIFAPVALTWFAIGEATRAFAQFISAGGETTANFLVFWQDGKGILDEKWRIGNVATLDFQIIVVLIILSLIAGLMQARSLQISTRDNAIFEDERIALALRISSTLNPHRAISDPTMSKSLVLLIDRLERVAKNLDSAGKEMVTNARVLTPKMKSSLGDIEKSSSRVKRAATEVQRTSLAINKVAKRIKPPLERRSRG